MLPAAYASAPSLADVLRMCLARVSGRPAEGTSSLPAASRAVVVLVDGLGALALKARAGHARFLAGRLTGAATIDSGFPTTTASGIATLTTGTTPGRHGLVGYRVFDAAHDRVVNQLTGWDDDMVPETWQRSETLFQAAGRMGVPGFAVGPGRYRRSGYTRAVLRGSEYVTAKTIDDRMAAAADLLRSRERSIVYVYIPELDMAAHAHGWQSQRWLAALEETDAAVGALSRSLRAGDGALVTADHGVLDVPAHRHVLFDREPGLVDGVRHVAGDPRCLHLHLAGADEDDRRALKARWLEAEGSRAWVATRSEAVAAGWFGPEVEPEVLARIGDVVVAARAQIAYYDSRETDQKPRAMIGQHGSFSPEEVRVPLIGLGAFAA